MALPIVTDKCVCREGYGDSGSLYEVLKPFRMTGEDSIDITVKAILVSNSGFILTRPDISTDPELITVKGQKFSTFFDGLLQEGYLKPASNTLKKIIYNLEEFTSNDEAEFPDPEFMLSHKFENRFKQVNTPFLYRGITIPDEAIDRINSGESFHLNKKDFSSWTISENISRNFISDRNYLGTPVVIKVASSRLPIMLNINSYYSSTEYASFEHEILVYGNGIDNISKDNIAWVGKSRKPAPEKKLDVSDFISTAILELRDKGVNLKDYFEQDPEKYIAALEARATELYNQYLETENS